MIVAVEEKVTTDLSVIREYAMPKGMIGRRRSQPTTRPGDSAGASDLHLREFDVESGEILRTFKGHHGPIRCVRYHPAGKVQRQ